MYDHSHPSNAQNNFPSVVVFKLGNAPGESDARTRAWSCIALRPISATRNKWSDNSYGARPARGHRLRADLADERAVQRRFFFIAVGAVKAPIQKWTTSFALLVTIVKVCRLLAAITHPRSRAHTSDCAFQALDDPVRLGLRCPLDGECTASGVRLDEGVPSRFGSTKPNSVRAGVHVPPAMKSR